jgi:CO/xanthine dehydrogenase Mo-binding subunit
MEHVLDEHESNAEPDMRAAIANAVFSASGARIRDYPITLDKLLSKLPVPA